jgi:hypothetical protein
MSYISMSYISVISACHISVCHISMSYSMSRIHTVTNAYCFGVIFAEIISIEA